MKQRAFWLGLGRLADPRLTLASVSSMLLGAAAAAREAPLDFAWLSATVIGILSLEVAKNASGEITDFDSGADLGVSPADRSPFSGGRRVLIDGLLSRRQICAISAVTYTIGIAIGLTIAALHEPRILAVGLVGTALAWCYGAAPLRLAYRGGGEIAVAVVYGPLICVGTFLVQHHSLTPGIIWLSLPLGLLVGGFLWINEFPDYLADCSAGKKNLVVRLGRVRAGHAFTAILASAFGLQLMLPLFALPRTVWLGLVGVPFAWAAARRVAAGPENTPRIIRAQRWTLQSFIILSAATSLGFFLVRPHLPSPLRPVISGRR